MPLLFGELADKTMIFKMIPIWELKFDFFFFGGELNRFFSQCKNHGTFKFVDLAVFFLFYCILYFWKPQPQDCLTFSILPLPLQDLIVSDDFFSLPLSFPKLYPTSYSHLAVTKDRIQ